jgi:hypothetical protein
MSKKDQAFITPVFMRICGPTCQMMIEFYIRKRKQAKNVPLCRISPPENLRKNSDFGNFGLDG